MRVLILNQAFYPDVVSTAQHASDLARRLTQDGHEVTAVCSRRGYDDPTTQFAPHEQWQGVRIVRIPCAAFGKTTRLGRALNFATFIASCLARLTCLGRFDLVVAMTTPPLLSVAAATYARLFRSKLVLWIMDLNPDQAIAAGWLRERSRMARFLQSLLAYSFRSASHIVVLDRFMRARIAGKRVPKERVAVIPPWSHGEAAPPDDSGRELFRKRHGLDGRFVVMYSGNHSPCHPLDTLLEAARSLSARSEIAFCFIGGGSEFRKVKEFAARHELRNIVCLPYQPLEKLPESLSAADLHTVVMGEKFVGIVHPCKIYNILSQGTPFLYIGPSPSHIRDIVGADSLQDFSYSAHHGDVRAVVESVFRAMAKAQRRVPALIDTSGRFSMDVLAPRMVRLLEAVAAGSSRATVQVSEDVPETGQ